VADAIDMAREAGVERVGSLKGKQQRENQCPVGIKFDWLNADC
jgi:hypothetical protein